MTPHGRLELTWSNKDMSLLFSSDGGYDWVHTNDVRIAETRLLEEAGHVGDAEAENLLIEGDAVHALRSLGQIPELERRFARKVKLVYLDPPFNTGQTFEHYEDALEHSVWLTMMRDRLLEVRELVADDGSIWVHCDDYEQHRLRCLLDEVFGPRSFIATIVWQKRYSRDNRPSIGAVHDYIHVYSPMGGEWKNVRNRVERDAKTARQYRNPNGDPRGAWRAIPMTAQGFRPNQMYEIVAPNGRRHVPPRGRCWSMVRPRFDELLRQGRIYWGASGDAAPGVIRYLSETEGLVPWTWWPHEEVGHTDEAKKEALALSDGVAFDTPKPERLMRRIIEVGSNPGDLVLDCFAGSGTTAAVAHKLGRRWVTVEREPATVEGFIRSRLESVVRGEDPGGVTDAAAWRGGGGFKLLRVAPSMFEQHDGLTMLSEWATGERLARAVAAQLNYEWHDAAPFCGIRGRQRLAVIEGHVTREIARVVVEQLAEDEVLDLCATSFDDAVVEQLAMLNSGSRVRKLPQDIVLSNLTAPVRRRPRSRLAAA
jgi:adenine-specific DNA-methyltransferase